MSSTSRNYAAGELIRQLRLDRGLSPEALSFEVFKAGFGSVSGRTIRRVEREGMVPRVAHQFALAQFFERSVTSVWAPARQRVLS